MDMLYICKKLGQNIGVGSLEGQLNIKRKLSFVGNKGHLLAMQYFAETKVCENW